MRPEVDAIHSRREQRGVEDATGRRRAAPSTAGFSRCIKIEAQDSVQTAADCLITYNIHHLPVVDDTKGVIGVLSTTDLAAYLSDAGVPTA